MDYQVLDKLFTDIMILMSRHKDLVGMFVIIFILLGVVWWAT